MRKHLLISGLVLTQVVAALSAEVFDGLVLPFREVTVGSPVETRIDALEVREGDVVKEGDLLVRLYSGLEELEVKRAAAAVEKREFDAASSEDLYKDKLVSEDEALQARIELDLAKLMQKMAEEQVNLRRLKAPIDGVVVERLREAGDMVQLSEPIFVILDLKQVYVQFYVRAEKLSELSIGGQAEVTFPSLGQDEPVVGTIDYIDPRVDAASGLSRVRVLLQNKNGEIKVGVRALVSVDTDR